MRKLVTALVVVPLAIVFVIFAVANRSIVTITLDPFDSVNPAYALKMPLFLLILALLAVGIVVGGFIAWLGQHRWRVRARRAEAEARTLREKLIEQDWPPRDPRVRAAREEASPLVFPPAA